jgi:hypothetical protein
MNTSFLKIALLVLMTATVHAAPMPGTSSSALVAPKLGLYTSPNGFQLQAGSSGWQQIPAPSDNKFIEAIYTTPKNGMLARTASLTVRVDKLSKAVPLAKYVTRWQKEYPKYGFDLLGSKPFVQNKNQGYVLDLLNRQSGKQMRQVIFMNEKKHSAIILTCRDDVNRFKSTIKGCNQIVRTFTLK